MTFTRKKALSLVLVASAAIGISAQSAGDIPAYHDAPPKPSAKLEPILPPDSLQLDPQFSKFWGTQRNAYKLAAKVGKVAYQQPCYCHCDRSIGHTSLRSCFTDHHGENCGVCMKEMFYTYQQTKAGKKPAEIRSGIVRGEWQNVDLEKAAEIQ